MKIDLLSLLASHEIIHPTRLLGFSASRGKLRFELQGYVWWKPVHSPSESNISFIFSEVDAGQLDMSIFDAYTDQDEVLEDFSIETAKPGDWDEDAEIAIFCQSAVPDPEGLYARLHGHLQRERSWKGPHDYLNSMRGQLKRFAALTQTPPFLLSRAPESVNRFLATELDSQGVQYYFIPEDYPQNGEARFKPRLIVRWLDSVFRCGSAHAEFS